MQLSKRIATAIWSSLLYDFCCMRGNLFGESYLLTSVGNVLQSFYGGKKYIVAACSHHPILSTFAIKGRKPEVDYIVTNYDDSSSIKRGRNQKKTIKKNTDINLISAAIETKWAGSSHCSTENLIWDFIRIALLTQENPNMEGLVILAGRVKDIDKLKIGLKKIIKFENATHVLNLKPTQINEQILTDIFKKESLQQVYFPLEINYSAYEAPLVDEPSSTDENPPVFNPSKISVVVWKITNPKEEFFKPSEVEQFKTYTD